MSQWMTWVFIKIWPDNFPYTNFEPESVLTIKFQGNKYSSRQKW